MNHKVTVWAVTAALVATITGCSNCQATDSGAGKSGQPAAAQKQQPKKAATPEGQVIWIVAEWDACCMPAPKGKMKPCKNAKCWKTKDGSTICVKLLRKCQKNGKGCPAEHFHSKRQNAVMCPQENPNAAAQTGNCCYAAKVVQNCPANGGKACTANEHVNMPGGKKGCSKADRKKPAQANVPVEMDDSFETDEVFEITSSN